MSGMEQIVSLGVKTIDLDKLRKLLDAVNHLLFMPVLVAHNEVLNKIIIRVSANGYYIVNYVDADISEVVKALEDAGYIKVAEQYNRIAGVMTHLIMFDRPYIKELIEAIE